jgi:hypothetical protein
VKKKTENAMQVIVPSETMRSITERRPRQIEMDPDDLSVNLNIFLSQMDDILSEAPDSVGKFRLNELEVTVEISAEGKVVLWGIGGGVGGKGGLSLTFTRER